MVVEGILVWEKELKETEEISRGVFGADIDGSVDKQHQQIRKAASFASERGVGKPVSIKTIRNEEGGGGRRGAEPPRAEGDRQSMCKKAGEKGAPVADISPLL